MLLRLATLNPTLDRRAQPVDAHDSRRKLSSPRIAEQFSLKSSASWTQTVFRVGYVGTNGNGTPSRPLMENRLPGVRLRRAVREST